MIIFSKIAKFDSSGQRPTYRSMAAVGDVNLVTSYVKVNLDSDMDSATRREPRHSCLASQKDACGMMQNLEKLKSEWCYCYEQPLNLVFKITDNHRQHGPPSKSRQRAVVPS